jgi:hypothetical protein
MCFARIVSLRSWRATMHKKWPHSKDKNGGEIAEGFNVIKVSIIEIDLRLRGQAASR